MYYNCVKFHKNPISGLGGVVLTRYMDGWMDGLDRVIPIYPRNFECGGFNNYHKCIFSSLFMHLLYCVSHEPISINNVIIIKIEALLPQATGIGYLSQF